MLNNYSGVISALFIGLVGLTSAENYYHSKSGNSLYCQDLNPQHGVDIENIMGMWFGTEVITHHDHEIGEFVYDSCITVMLSEITHEVVTTTHSPHHRSMGSDYYHDRNPEIYRERQLLDSYHKNQPTRYIRLEWDEKGVALEYTLRFNNSRRGFWVSTTQQKGTMTDLHYNQFTGTIQVIKAVGNHIVLTFCQNLPTSQLFSIVLTRHFNELRHDEIQSIRGLLRRRGLSTNSVRKVCRNSSSSMTTSLAVVFLGLIAFILKY